MATLQLSSQPEQNRDTDWPGARWYAADLGFFNPDYNGKIIAMKEAIEHARKDTIFRDVYLFIERAKDIAAV